jgi:NADP-dependent 3-hydroxy acid dehydrogenase YdfG
VDERPWPRARTHSPDEDLDVMFRDNVKSALYGIQAILPHFQALDAGQIARRTQRSCY